MSYVYIYVDGSDNAANEAALVASFARLAAKWQSLGAVAVNHRQERTPELRPNDFPDWSIGLNLPLEQFGASQATELVPFARALAQATGQDLVVGIASSSNIAEDLVFLGPEAGERELHALLQHVAGP